MKTSIFGWLGVVIACAALAGCGEDKHIAEVKALPFSYPSENVPDPNMTVDQALDYRKVCDSVKWKVDQTEQHQTFVQYTCTYKGVKESQFEESSQAVHPKNIPADVIGDVYQWVYGADGKPTFSYVAMQYHFSNGNTKDWYYGNAWQRTNLMKAAVNNSAEDYDHFRSEVTGEPIPYIDHAYAKAFVDGKIGPVEACVHQMTVNYVMQERIQHADETIHPDQLKTWQDWCKAQHPAATSTIPVPATAMSQTPPPAEKATGDSAFVNAMADGTSLPPPTSATTAAQSSDKGLDACEQSWTDAFHKESGQDAAISQDQLNEWDGWCKRGYDASKGVPPDA